ncbi:MAG TPA: hypothetical protein VLI88_03485 [Patescibacteria group bacterium]|jgi:hypothetical protein|nr:hypothetical protein [Patescibacteria group bacterium]
MVLIRLPVRHRAEPAPEAADDLGLLLSGSKLLLREGNRIAALALLWAAVALDPVDLTAHRRLAAVLANSGDLHGALDEHARYREFLRARGEFEALRNEVAYAAATLGEILRPRMVGESHDPSLRLRRYLTPAI